MAFSTHFGTGFPRFSWILVSFSSNFMDFGVIFTKFDGPGQIFWGQGVKKVGVRPVFRGPFLGMGRG